MSCLTLNTEFWWCRCCQWERLKHFVSLQIDFDVAHILQYFDKPISYVQQVVVKAAPHPSLSVQEGFKSSLEPMFDLLEHVDAFRFQDEWVI